MLALNRALDRLASPNLRLLGLARSSFQVCGFVGFAAGAGLGLLLAARLGLSLWLLGALLLVAASSFLVLAIATKLLLGSTRLVFYHHAAALLASTSAFLWLRGAPILPYLDVAVLGLGAFLTFGRLGCFMVGCCFGCPHTIGVVYRDVHAAAGFDRCLVGVRLFPTQLLEAAWSLALVAGGAWLVWRRQLAPGDLLAGFILLYASARFVLELVRGDAFRPIVGGFSEAQWTSLVAVGAVLLAERLSLLPAHRWHQALATLVPFGIFFVASWRFLGTPRHRLLHPQHVREVAQALELLGNVPRAPSTVAVGTTSLGVRISGQRLDGPDGPIEHFAISQADDTMSEETAQVVTDLIQRLRRQASRTELIVGQLGVFHLLLHGQSTNATSQAGRDERAAL
jgi:prolipoprotein diacylglyceryltransferase